MVETLRDNFWVFPAVLREWTRKPLVLEEREYSTCIW